MMNLTSPKSPTTVLWTRGVTSDSRMYVARASLEGDEKKAMKILQAMVSKDIKELMGLRSMHFHVKIT